MPDRHTDISTRTFTVPASTAVKGRMLRSLRWPIAILSVPAAIAAVLAFSDWRFLVVLFLLVLVGGSAIYAFAWFHTAMSPAAIEALRPHRMETDGAEIRIIAEDGSLMRHIPMKQVDGIDAVGKYLCVRYSDGDQPALQSTLYIPVDAFPSPDAAARFLDINNPELRSADIIPSGTSGLADRRAR